MRLWKVKAISQVGWETAWGHQAALKDKTSAVGTPFSQDMQKPFWDKWGKIQDAMEAAMVMEKNLNQALLLELFKRFR